MPAKHLQQMQKMAETVSAYGELTGDETVRGIGQILGDVKFRAVLNEFHDSPESRRKASRNATAYCKRQGVKVPRGIKVTLKDNNWRASLCAKVEVFGVGIEYGAHYDSESGFGWGC
jgi:hypothetical protein